MTLSSQSSPASIRQLPPQSSDSSGQFLLFSDLATPVVSPCAAAVTPEWYDLAEEFLSESEGLYPGITAWWRKRVVPGIGSGQRLCRLVSVNGEIAAISITKLHNKSSKLCTLRVGTKFQRLGIGRQLLHSTLSDLLKTGTRRVHFTISEEVFADYGAFFIPYGFYLAHWRRGWYIRGAYELAYSARASTIQNAISGQMSLFKENSVVLLSVRPEHAEAIEQGRKRVEFRRQFSNRAKSAAALFYASSPISAFRLSASITDVIKGHPEILWKRFAGVAGCTKQQFDSYFHGSDRGYALILDNVNSLPKPVAYSSTALRALNFRPPQSYAIVHCNDPVVNAVATAR